MINKEALVRSQKPRARPDLFHASSVGGCERKAVLVRGGAPQPEPDAELLRKFWLGEELHKIVQKVVENNPAFSFFGHEVDILSEEFHIAGSMDTLVGTPDGIMVFEYKTMSSEALLYGHGLPYPQHVMQLAVYMTFQAEDKPLPNSGLLIYIGKNAAEVREFYIAATPELRGNVRGALLRLEAYYQKYLYDGTLPPRLEKEKKLVRKKEVEVLPWECQRCPFQARCWPDEPLRERSARPESPVSPGG